MILSDTKGGREMEVAFIPQKIADRLKEYIQTAKINSESKIFPISYTAAWSIVGKAGKLVGIHLRPHDLRRHAATYASRSGTPIEIISIMCSAIQIYRQHKDIWEKSATPRQ